MTIRNFLLRLPVLGKIIERRWMPNPAERDLHQEIVLARLAAPTGVDLTTESTETTEAQPPTP